MTFVNESCFATVPSCTVSVFPSGIHPVMTFAFQKLPTATAQCSKHFASQNGLRPPRFLRGAYFAVHWSKHFATQNGLRPPRFLRGAYFAVHKRQRSSLFLTAPFSSGCILVRSVFAILRVSSLTNKKIAICKAAK